MAASTVGRIHTHLRNAVPLVWGSLRLAPIKAKVKSKQVSSLKTKETRTTKEQNVVLFYAKSKSQ